MPVMRKNVHKKSNSWVNDDSETNVYFQKNMSASTKQHHYDNNCTPPPPNTIEGTKALLWTSLLLLL